MICRVVSCVVSIILATFLLSCSSSPTLSSMQVSPATPSTTAGTTVQFTATGVYTHGSHPTQTQNITDSVTWSSSSPTVASINSSGLATPLSAGTTTITATMSSSFGPVTGTATLTVTSGTSSGLTSLSIIPGLGIQTVASLGETAQFLAIGTFSASPTTVDLTDSVTWLSSDVDVATINSTGLATATGCESTSCTTTITASTTSGLAGCGKTTVRLKMLSRFRDFCD
jgi:small neutral amino acid transporter SnatA (MarC family)